MVDLRPGSRWRATSGSAEIVVVRAPAGDVALECNGASMEVPDGTERPVDDAGPGEEGLLLGKRYEEATLGLELLCSKPGAGPLTVNGRPLVQKTAKPLPSSD